MSISYALLGFLSWRPHTGYDLKKLLLDSLSFYWTGNNAQIYRSLTELHREGLVTQEVQVQEKYPARKVYTITDKGREALRAWVTTLPELPQVRNTFLVQLAWADQLEADELDGLLRGYEHELEMQILMRREMQRRGTISPARTEREAFVWRMLEENGISALEAELTWAGQVRSGMPAMPVPPARPRRN
jgi:PadR family transcriptional regulator, regulatory protein AphA